MRNLKNLLKNRLQGAVRIVVLGVGSELRADDAAGMLVAGRLRDYYKKRTARPAVKVLLGSTAPENLTGEIKKLRPSHIIIVDSADTGKKAGTIVLINPQEIGGISFCTHQLPPKILVDYLLQSLDCRVIVIGIQPKTLLFGAGCSREVENSIQYLVDTLKEIINGEKERSVYKKQATPR